MRLALPKGQGVKSVFHLLSSHVFDPLCLVIRRNSVGFIHSFALEP